ncbi:NPCBM/NEW2 domain-containing protein [Paenibacillus sp. CMAA1364]
MSRSTRKHFIFLFVITFMVTQLISLNNATVQAAPTDSGGVVNQSVVTNNQPGLTPIMGWSSWNAFRINISEQLLHEQADAMVSSGMKDAGYQFVNLDDGWIGGRDTTGVPLPNPKFPSGMKSLADYIHSKGLKAGIYTDAGRKRCATIYDNDPYTTVGDGSYDYGQLDFDTYIKTWGYNFVKVDWCGGEIMKLDQETEYKKIKQYIENTGIPTVYEVCSWKFPGAWVADVASQWRISGDIAPTFASITSIIDINAQWGQYAKPGHFNHMDMLQVGNGMTYEEDKSHFSMWAIMASPLVAGNDLRTMSAQTKEILTNQEVIAVNQDPMGIQGTRIVKDGNKEVWAKPLDNRSSGAVALFNRGNAATNMTVNWSDLGLTGSASVRDLWAHQDKGSFNGSYTVNVPAHGIVVLKIKGNTSFGIEKFQFNKNSKQNLPITMASDGKVFVDIKKGNDILVNGLDYVMDGQRLILKKEYLKSLTNGHIAFTLNYSEGWSQKISIEVLGQDGFEYLSDLPWVKAISGWDVVRRDKGGPEAYNLTINNVVYPKGLWTNSNSEIVYKLDQKYREFKAFVGNDDFQRPNGSIIYQVWTDGTKRYDSGLMRGSENITKEISVDISQNNELKLVVLDGGDNNWFDRSIWADAKVMIKDDNTTLRSIQIDNKVIEGFDNNKYVYDVELPAGTLDIPTVTAATYHASAITVVSAATTLPGTTTIKVTAENGSSTQLYSINFGVKSNNTIGPVTTLLGDSTVQSGQTYHVVLGLAGVTNNVYAEDITLNYDANLFEFVSAQSIKSGVNLVESKQTAPGKIRLILASEGPSVSLIGDTPMVEMIFTAQSVQQSAVGNIAVVNAVIADSTGIETEAGLSTLQVQIQITIGIPGDMNNDGKVSIGDLAFAAANYGKNESSPDWNQVKIADMNKDRVIDIIDLAAIATKIIQ